MTKYGSEQVLPYNNEEHKTTQVRRMFDSIAGTYDQLNHTLSLGIDKIWRRKGIAFLRPFSPASILDIATGTGDLAISMHRRLKADRIIGADISEGMMEVGRQKVAEAGLSDHITFEYQDCTELSSPVHFPMKQLYNIYSKVVIPTVGRLLSKEHTAYSYLPASIKVVPQGKVMTDLLSRVGFSEARSRTFTFGICSLYTGSKSGS